MSTKTPHDEIMWVYQREDGCELELYAATEEAALHTLREFGIVNPSIDRLKVMVKRGDPIQIDWVEK
jgi:hypothetical protein